jgi:hypothetical protein
MQLLAQPHQIFHPKKSDQSRKKKKKKKKDGEEEGISSARVGPHTQ